MKQMLKDRVLKCTTAVSAIIPAFSPGCSLSAKLCEMPLLLERTCNLVKVSRAHGMVLVMPAVNKATGTRPRVDPGFIRCLKTP